MALWARKLQVPGVTTPSETDASSMASVEAEAPAAAPVADADQRLWDELDECGIAHFRERARSTELVRCAQRGIPPARRAAVWHACAGSAELRARFAHDVYSRLLHQPCAELKPIERDIRRTFPELLALSKGASERLVRSLGHVLKAYAVYDPGTGYCQGMNYVAAISLLRSEDEESAFWLFVQLLHRHGLRDLFSPSGRALGALLAKFDGALQRRSPKLSAHLKQLGITTNMYATQWFTTVFSYQFPLGFCERVWDVMIVLGATEAANAPSEGGSAVGLGTGFDGLALGAEPATPRIAEEPPTQHAARPEPTPHGQPQPQQLAPHAVQGPGQTGGLPHALLPSASSPPAAAAAASARALLATFTSRLGLRRSDTAATDGSAAMAVAAVEPTAAEAAPVEASLPTTRARSASEPPPSFSMAAPTASAANSTAQKDARGGYSLASASATHLRVSRARERTLTLLVQQGVALVLSIEEDLSRCSEFEQLLLLLKQLPARQRQAYS